MIQKNNEFFKDFFYDFDEVEISKIIEDNSEFRIGYIPFSIERLSDGKILQLNSDNRTYSFTHTISLNPTKYSWGRLFRDSRCIDAFKELGWVKIENLETMHKFIKDKNENNK